MKTNFKTTAFGSGTFAGLAYAAFEAYSAGHIGLSVALAFGSVSALLQGFFSADK